MRGYAHHLVSPQIRDILISENEELNSITYSIIFNTNNGVFLGIVEFNKRTQLGLIRSLVLIDAASLRRVLRGCKLQDETGRKCKSCENNFYLN